MGITTPLPTSKKNELSLGLYARGCVLNQHVGIDNICYSSDNFIQLRLYSFEPLPGVLGNTGTVAFIFREQGIFSNYFQGTGELLTRLLGSFLGTRGFSNGEQGIKSKKVKGSWEHAPPLGGAQFPVFGQQ